MRAPSRSAPVKEVKRPINLWRSVGPAIIVASVVLGPGSILAGSRVGAAYGYSLNWILALSCLLMMGMVILGARLGVGLDDTPCTVLAHRLGRPTAIFIGLIVFSIITCFQTGNNTAVLAVFQSPANAGPTGAQSNTLFVAGLVALNGIAIASLYGFRHVYRGVERLMKGLVLVMIIGFAGNFLLARPDVTAALEGFIPRLPEGLTGGFLPVKSESGVIDPLGAIPALIATTLSVAGAFYQAYLVREKGWTRRDLTQGTIDSCVGVAVLGGITLLILMTSAAVFHGRLAAEELRSTSEVARQLEPLFGPWAKALFNLGILGGALSSLLVNALIGGTLLADGLGFDCTLEGRWTKAFTTAALIGGMLIAIGVQTTGANVVGIILFAQALTVIGLPALALAMLYLGTIKPLRSPGLVPVWVLGLAGLCFVASLLLAVRKAYELWLRFGSQT